MIRSSSYAISIRPFNCISVHESGNQRMSGLPYAKHLLWTVFAGSRGGQNRIRLIHALRNRPLNAHQLSKELILNYKAIEHHLSVLEKNNLITRVGEKYGANYFLSTFLEVNMSVFDEIVANLYKSK